MVREAWFGHVEETDDTPHKIAPKAHEVFGDDVDPTIVARIFPLLTVDAGDLELGVNGFFHFLYTELEHLHFRREANLYLSVDDYASVEEFYDGEKPWKPVAEWHGRSVRFAKISLPKRGEEEDDYDYGYRLEKLAKERLSGATGEIRMGGPPLWVQSPNVPIAGDKSPMRFIGQIVATALTDYAADAALYLFYDPAEERVTQVSQFT